MTCMCSIYMTFMHCTRMACMCYTRDLHWLSHTNLVYKRSSTLFTSFRQNLLLTLQCEHTLHLAHIPLISTIRTCTSYTSYNDPREQGIPAVQLGPLRFLWDQQDPIRLLVETILLLQALPLISFYTFPIALIRRAASWLIPDIWVLPSALTITTGLLS